MIDPSFTHALSFLWLVVLLQMIDTDNDWNYVYIKKLDILRKVHIHGSD